jgi:outer membrane protein assembly factor BamB
MLRRISTERRDWLFWSAAIAAIAVVSVASADWRQFRGDDNRSRANVSAPPLNWSEAENVAWKIDLPGRGASSPIVVDGRVVVTCSDGPNEKELGVVCFDQETGKRLWRRQFWATGRTYCHPSSCNAAPTPASDGKRIFAFYSSVDLACLDLDGNLLWYRALALDYPGVGNDVGMSSSPVVVGDVVIVQAEAQDVSFVEGIDAATGKTRWHLDRDAASNWASPTIVRGKTSADDRVLLQSPRSGVMMINPANGQTLWQYDKPCGAIASSVAADGKLLIPSGGMTAFSLEGDGPGDEPIWQAGRLNSSSPSPVVHEGRLYVVSRSVLNCADLETGDVAWQLRLAAGQYWASPVAVDDRLYIFNYDGKTQVVEIGPDLAQGKVIGGGDFGEPIQGTPAFVEGAMFVRSDRHLWKIAGR